MDAAHPDLIAMAVRRVAAFTALTATLTLTSALTLTTGTGPAAATPTAGPRPTPGLGAPVPCQTAVGYTVNGHAIAPRPLPSPASQVGGRLLAQGGLQVTSSATAPPPAPKATAWLVADLDTGQVLAACNAHVPLAPASSLKVLTSLALYPRIPPATRYVARDEDARVDGTRVGLVPGSVYTADNLWHALLMSSANDAAVALGSLAGGQPAATDAMRSTAAALGAADTVPRNTSGLDLPGQVSSAYDLALFGRAALAEPHLVTLMQTRSYTFPEAGAALPGARLPAGAKPRGTFQIQNHDKLLYNYRGALGVKNGWTSTTGGSFVGAAQRGGRRLVATVLAADPETWHMCAGLLDWGFTATTRSATGVGRLVDGPDPDGALPGAAAASPGAGGAGPAALAANPTSRPAGSRGGGSFPSGTVAVVLATALVAVAGAAGATQSARRRSRASDRW